MPRPSATWCPSTPATSSWADCECCGGASMVVTKYASSSTSSSTGSRRGARWPRCERPDVHHLGRDRGTLFGHSSSDRAQRHQIGIEPLRRPYPEEEASGLVDLIGPRERWVNTQRTFLWQHSTAMVQGFTGATEISLPLECTYDFEVAASKYLHALRDGDVPLLFLFSGTVFVH